MAREMTPEQIEQHKAYVRELVNSGIIINTDDSSVLDGILEKAYAIMEDKNLNTEDEKNKAFGEYRELAMSFGRTLGGVLYNFGVDENEYKLLKKVIMREIEYDRQDNHIGLLVKDEYFGAIESKPGWQKTKFADGVEILPCDINTTTRISHIFGQYKVKGLGGEAETYYEISKKIIDISKVFEYYNNMGEQMSVDASNWIQGLEPEEAIVEEITDGEEKVLVNKEVRPKL